MKNIFEIYQDNGRVVPFLVRRASWSDAYALVVTDVMIKKFPYGTAIGFGLKPLDGSKYTDYWGTEEEPKPINCAGCYQWELVTERIPPEWKEALTREMRVNLIIVAAMEQRLP